MEHICAEVHEEHEPKYTKVIPAIIGALLSSLLTGSVLWFSYAKDTVPRVEVAKMIQLEAPYIRDKAMIEAQFRSLEAQQNRVQEAIVRIEDKIDRLLLKSSR